MQHKKAIAAGVGIAVIALFAYLLTGRREVGVSADDQAEAPKSFFSQLTSRRTQENAVVPNGTKIEVRLEQAISSEKNSSGDRFQASLDTPLTIEGKTLAPAGSDVMGELTSVNKSGRVEGRASLTMALSEIVVDGKKYRLDTEPLTIVAKSTKKKDAKVIAGGAALGAVIGAIAGGGKGAAIGAASGGGAGTGYVLATKGAAVEYGAETRFTFTLTSPVELPVLDDKS